VLIKLNTSISKDKQTYIKLFSAQTTLVAASISNKNSHSLIFPFCSLCIFPAKLSKNHEHPWYFHQLPTFLKHSQSSFGDCKQRKGSCYINTLQWQISNQFVSSKFELKFFKNPSTLTIICTYFKLHHPNNHCSSIFFTAK